MRNILALHVAVRRAGTPTALAGVNLSWSVTHTAVMLTITPASARVVIGGGVNRTDVAQTVWVQSQCGSKKPRSG